MDKYIDLCGIHINEIKIDMGKIVTFTYEGKYDPTLSIDEAIRIYTTKRDGLDPITYKEFIDANMDNPWVRIVITTDILDIYGT